MFIDLIGFSVLGSRFLPFAYFVFSLGEGDAVGEGLTAVLGLVAGAVPVALLGALEFELLAGSSVAQPAAKTSARIIESRSAARLAIFIFGLLIFLPRSSKIEKRDDDCPDAI